MRLREDLRNRGPRAPDVCFSFRLEFISHAGVCDTAVHWGGNEVLLFTDPKGHILRISFPEYDAHLSPTHGITFCNGPPGNPQACTHGPSLSSRGWHDADSDHSGRWQCHHSHSPESACLPLVFSNTIPHDLLGLSIPVSFGPLYCPRDTSEKSPTGTSPWSIGPYIHFEWKGQPLKAI